MKDYMSTLNALKEEQQNVPIYCTLYDNGCHASINTHLIIENESHEANEVVWMAMAIVDLMLEQMERDEPSTTTDLFTLVADGERMQFDPAVLVLDGEESELTRWHTFRERFLNGANLEFGHQYISEPDEQYTPIFGIPRLFADLLEGGKFAQWVTMIVNLDNGDYGTWKAFRTSCPQRQWRLRQRCGDDFFGQSYWMNGLRDGQYVCGEIPFVQDDAAMMSVGSWYQSMDRDWTDCDDQPGIILTLMPNIPNAFLEKVATLGRKFNEKLSCDVEMNLTPYESITLKGNREPLSLDERVELYRSWYGMDSATDQQLAARAHRDDEAERNQESKPVRPKSWEDDNEQVIRIYLDRFAEMRRYFNDEEVEAFLASNPRVQELLTRHAAEKYTEDEIRLYRFGVSLLTLIEIIDRHDSDAKMKEMLKANDKPHQQDDTALSALIAYGWPEHLIEKARTLPDELKKNPSIVKKSLIGEREYMDEVYLQGMNDLCRNDEIRLIDIYHYGINIRVTHISLNSREDVLTLEALLNEMAELENEAHTTDPVFDEDEDWPISLVLAMGYGYSLEALWMNTLDEDDERRPHREPDAFVSETETDHYNNVLTNREMYARMRSIGYCYLEDSAIQNEPFDFDATDDGVFARLRFRRDNGRFIHEVSFLDGEEG